MLGRTRPASSGCADACRRGTSTTPRGATRDLDGFAKGLEWVDSIFADRRYRVEHVVAEEGTVAAFLSWTATRRSDGAAVEGRGAYHCRLEDGLVAEDWDVFFPAG